MGKLCRIVVALLMGTTGLALAGMSPSAADSPAVLEVSADESVAPGEAITLEARLTRDSQPVAGVPIRIFDGCSRTGQYRTTDADGRIRLVDDRAHRCPQVEYFLSAEADIPADEPRAEVVVAVTWAKSRLSLTVPDLIELDQAADISGRLLIDDAPAPAGTPVGVMVDGPGPGLDYSTQLTDARGRFTLTTRTYSAAGAISVGVGYDGDDVTLPSSASDLLGVRAIRTALTVDPVPNQVTSGEEITVSGRLVDENGSAMPGAPLLVRLSGAFPARVDLVTAQDGSFSHTVTTDYAAVGSFDVHFLGDDRHRDAHVERQYVTVHPREGRLSVTAPPKVLVGEPIHITGTLTDLAGTGDRGSRVLFSFPDSDVNDGGETEAFAAADGSFSFTHPAQVDTGAVGFTVSAPRPSRVTAQETFFFVHVVTPTLRSRAVGHDGSARRAASYRVGDDAGIVTRAAPRRAGLCLRYVVQERRGDRWRGVTTSTCRRTDTTSRARFDLPGRQRSGDRYRVRPVWRSVAGPTRGDWVPLRFG